MERVEMWRAYDGQCFESSIECEEHEKCLAAGILDPYVIAFNSDGHKISWADYGETAVIALVKRVPTQEELEDNQLGNAWADYLDSDLESELSPRIRKPENCVGWWIRDPWAEYWHPWEQAHKEFNDLIEILLEVQTKKF